MARVSGGLATIVVVCVVALALLTPSATSAAPVRGCGDLASRAAYNITTRKVHCEKARMIVRRWGNTAALENRGDGQVLDLECNFQSLGIEYGDIRCTGDGGRVVHWQTGA